MTVYIPMPRQVQGIQAMQRCAFIEDEQSYKTLFVLYFAAVCHALQDMHKLQTIILTKNGLLEKIRKEH